VCVSPKGESGIVLGNGSGVSKTLLPGALAGGRLGVDVMQMGEPVEQIRRLLFGISGLYNRLVLVVGPAGSGKTATARAVAQEGDRFWVSLGIELSRRLLDLTERQRIIQLPQLLEEIVSQQSSGLLILDNTEILFNPALKQDPLRLLLGLSRNRTIVATWLGQVANGHLIYATPDHPEFRRYPAEGLLTVSLSAQKLANPVG
jgi:hypothetical protein